MLSNIRKKKKSVEHARTQAASREGKSICSMDTKRSLSVLCLVLDIAKKM